MDIKTSSRLMMMKLPLLSKLFELLDLLRMTSQGIPFSTWFITCFVAMPPQALRECPQQKTFSHQNLQNVRLIERWQLNCMVSRRGMG
jgi:hypothetical protein